MNRVEIAARLIAKKKIAHILDVGCRDNTLKSFLPDNINYDGNDLFQNENNGVKYVGDISSVEIPAGIYDGVVAIDILEHTDDPYSVFENMVEISSRFLFVGLPNTYDLKGRWQVLFGKRNDKYRFHSHNVLDRHRWMMHYDDIVAFYEVRAREFNMKLDIVDIKYGGGKKSFFSSLAVLLRFVLPKTLSTSSIVGVFEKQDNENK